MAFCSFSTVGKGAMMGSNFVPPPTNLAYTASSATVSTVTISFTMASIPGIITYIPSTGSGTGGPTAYTISTLASNTSYDITLTAKKNGVSSKPSTSVSVLTLSNPPTSLTYSSATTTTIVISFTVPTGTGTITSYGPSTGTGSGSASSYTITGLVSNKIYSMTLTATNASGTSAASTALSVLTVPGPPTGLTYSSATTTSVVITFTVPSGDGTITSYGPSTGTGSGSASSYTITGLSSNTTISMTLTATNASGTSAASTALSVLTVPGPPTIGTATVTDSTHVSVAFTAPSGAGAITSYTVTSSPGSFTGTGTSSPITITATFVSGTAYTFTVTATNASGTSVSSGASNSVKPNIVILPNSGSIFTPILVPDGLLIYYKFNTGDIDGSGRITNYATGTTVKNATVYNSPSFSTTIAKVGGSSLYLNGSSQYINIDAWTTTQTGITITCWFYFISAGWTRLIDFGNGAGSNNILFAPQNGQYVTNSGGTTSPGSYGNWADSNWHFLAWTLSCDDKTNNTGTWNLYIDNVLKNNQTSARYPAPVSRSNNYIGLSNWAGDGYSTCYLNEFRFYTKVLNTNDISALYSNGVPSLSISNFQTTDINGISTSSGTIYQVYVFKSTGINYTVTYSFSQSTAISVLAVGGGGSGSSYAGGGGGAGLVVMKTVTVPAGTNTITIAIGAGGANSPSNNIGYSGGDTTVNFAVNSSLNITAYGGGAGASSDHAQSLQNIGGSGGGGGWSSGYPAGTTSNSSSSTTTFANNGGYSVGGGGGGGGAGAAGNVGKGGNGIQCTLTGISTFSPSGTAYSTYYWGGGGGGSGFSNIDGGLGGGGGGGYNVIGTGGGSALNAGGNGLGGGNGNGGAGGANTGGGGGGQWNNPGGAGGSGIVVLAYTGTTTYDGLSAATAAPSAAYLAATGNITNGVYWITIPTVGATQIYCILDRSVDGGGWMMAMKATTGTTFKYSANYWTTNNTLSPTDTTRGNADAKFDTMNYSGASDILALWPDITTVGGSLTLTSASYSCWSWLQNRFTSAGTFYAGTGNNPATTTVSGITPYMTLINWFNTISSARYFIQDAKTWPGWSSSIFSYQDNVRFYGFNYMSNTTAKARWGFGWNNEGSLFPNADMNSDDAGGGIGMGNNDYSAGNYGGPLTTHSSRVEIYIRDSSNAPSAPTIGSASISGSTVTVNFTGVAGASYYTAFSNTGGFFGSSSTSPITITGVNSGLSYTFTVKASNISGTSLASSASNTVYLTLDGSTSASAAPSAVYLVANGITTNGVYWINLPTAGPTQIYCILDPAVDGGGWMMAMKTTRGAALNSTTFNYSASYWTTNNTLNPTDTTRNDADAKFNTMNYSTASDILALWPDITTVGGSLNLTSYGCWSWLQNNFTSAGTFYGSGQGASTTTVSGITTSMTLIDWFSKISSVRYFIQDAITWPGWGNATNHIFTSQTDVRFYGFNYYDNAGTGSSNSVRWGFGWNENGGNLFPNGNMGSDDVRGGIGMSSSYYSAGDHIGCCANVSGINRSARVEIYIRESLKQVQSFTTINSNTISGALLATPSGYTSTNPCGLAVDLMQTKMIFAYNGNVCYATSSNSGTTWSAFTTVNLDSSAANTRHSCGLRNDGQYGYVMTATTSYTVTWTGSTPTFTSFDTTVAAACTSASFYGASMTPDGLTLMVKVYNGTLYYTRFNGTAFNAFTSTGLTADRVCCAITPDSSTVYVTTGGTEKYTSVTWNGNVGTFSALQSAVGSRTVDDRALVFLGGNYSGSSPPRYLFGGVSTLDYYPWNQATFTATESSYTRISSSVSPDSTNSYSPCGTKGNIIYFVNSGNIYTVTFNVT